jgi:ketosteroid isomerase-like protein
MSERDLVLTLFAEALQACERTGDVDELVALYEEDCTSGNVLRPDEYRGRDGARDFWRRYRAQFDDVASTFRVVAGDDRGGVLEWETTGTVNGEPVEYRGATVLEVRNGAITRSCAYFDPTALAPPNGSA